MGFKYVSRHVVGKRMAETWVAQRRAQGDRLAIYKAQFADEITAAKWMADQLGIPWKTLENVEHGKKNEQENAISQYYGVLKRPDGWVAYHQGKQKRCKSEQAVVVQSMEMRGVEALADMRKQKADRVLPSTMEERFHALMPIMQNHYLDDRNANVDHIVRTSYEMYDAEPTFIQISVHIKYRMSKDELLRQWVLHGKPSKIDKNTGVKLSDDDRAWAIWPILAELARKHDGVDLDEVIHNCGMNVSHVVGPMVLLAALRVVKKCIGARDTGVINVGVGLASRYSVLTTNTNRKASCRYIARCVRASTTLHKLVTSAPRKLEELQVSKKWYDEELALVNAPMLTKTATCYTRDWSFRAIADGANKRKHDRFEYRADMTCTQLHAIFPDVSQWTMRLAKRLGVTTVKKLFQKLGYIAEPEYFSMYACFFGSLAMDSFDMQQVKKYTKEIKQSQASYRDKYMQDAIPPRLLAFAREQGIEV
jgi:hypothetical protein